MRRLVPALVVVVVGCGKSTQPSVVKLPDGLPRPGDTRPTPPSESLKGVGQSETTPLTSHPSVSKDAPDSAATPSKSSTLRNETPRPVQSSEPTKVAVAPKPAMPSPDASHPLGYRTPGGNAIDVEGVCRFDESSVDCWGPDGRSSVDLTRRVERALASHTDFGSPNLQIRYGMKNRILVVKQTQVPSIKGPGDMRSLNLMNIGSDPRYGSGGYVQLQDDRNEWKAGEPVVRREARIFSVDKADRETQMRVMMSEPMRQVAELRLERGAKSTLEGCTFEVLAIAPATQPMFGGMGPFAGKSWTIKILQTGKPVRPASFYPRSLGTMMYVSKDGKPVDERVYSTWMRTRAETMRNGPGPISFGDNPFRPLQVMVGGSRPNGEMDVILNGDPKALGKIGMGGSYMKTIDVTGIPVDPR